MLDVAVSEQIVDLRWSPLTAVMLLLSAWWVKDLVFCLVSVALDVRRRRAPWSGALIAVATVIASQAADGLKMLFDRPRPFARHLWSGLGSLPSSSSMPSGHAATAAAAATALGMLVPAVRPGAWALAALICLSRVYLGVHFAGDVIAGAALGALIAAAVVIAGRRVLGDRLPDRRALTRRRRRPA